MKKNMLAFVALSVLSFSITAKADYHVQVMNKNASDPSLSSYSLTTVNYSVINNDGNGNLLLSGKSSVPSNTGEWEVSISKQALQNAGVSAYELIKILKENEATGKDSLSVIYDATSNSLRIVKY